MTTKRIVWQRPDGGISITHPTEDFLPGESEQHYLDRIAMAFLSAAPEHTTYIRKPDIDSSTLPKDRYFRNCWLHNGIAVAVDMTKAKAQRLSETQAVHDSRQKAITNQAVAAMLDNDNATLKTLKAKKQATTDTLTKVQTDLSAITDPDSLKNYNPVWPV